MTLKHLQQPDGSKLCGQTCVAMLAGVSIDIATLHCSSGKNRATSEHDLRKGLGMLGFGLDPFERWPRASANLPVEVVGIAPILARVREADRKHGYHWIVVTRTRVFDPGWSEALDVEAYHRLMARIRARVSSFARVLPLSAFLGLEAGGPRPSTYFGQHHETGTRR